MDIAKQIEYWRKSGEEDLEAARDLLERNRFRHALFLCHLALEKTLKAKVAKQTGQIPPRIHKLERLAEIGGLELKPEQLKFISEFGVYQVSGRYPDPGSLIEPETARRDFASAEEMMTWLKSQL